MPCLWRGSVARDLIAMLVIVPDSLRAAINEKLDAAIALAPDAESERENLFNQLLAYFNEHGVIPEFSLVKNPT